MWFGGDGIFEKGGEGNEVFIGVFVGVKVFFVVDWKLCVGVGDNGVGFVFLFRGLEWLGECWNWLWVSIVGILDLLLWLLKDLGLEFLWEGIVVVGLFFVNYFWRVGFWLIMLYFVLVLVGDMWGIFMIWWFFLCMFILL